MVEEKNNNIVSYLGNNGRLIMKLSLVDDNLMQSCLLHTPRKKIVFIHLL